MANVSLGNRGTLDIRGNPLNYTSIYTHIPILLDKGVNVLYDERTPTKLIKISDAPNVDTSETPSIAVEVQDERGYGFEGVPVTFEFTITSGNGTLSAISTTTDKNGRAKSTLTLDPDFQTSTIKVYALGIEQPVIFEINAETELLLNYPNPFNPETWIPFRLAEDAEVTLSIYDVGGRMVRTLNIGHSKAGIYESRDKAIYWDGRNDLGESVASGIYFYHLMAGEYSATKRMVILK